MRCRLRRSIYLLLLITFVIIILYQIHISNYQVSQLQSPFTTIHYKNRTYRILSSSYQYNSRGSYLNFAYFNVEQRDRVLRIDYLYDVPVSSQWQASGHLYPIQIAQFGLSHWSRLELNSMKKQNKIYHFDRLQPNQDNRCSSWYTLKDQISFSNTYIHFTISSNCSLHIQFLNHNIDLIYSTMTPSDIETSTKIIIPLQGSPRQVNRYMLIDIEKSIKKSLDWKNDHLQIRLCGESHSFVNQLIIGNQTLYDQQAFYSSTQYLLNTQDFQTGCWFSHVQRNFGDHDQYHLRRPWCSAMAQGLVFYAKTVNNFLYLNLGQAASLLVRLYSQTNNIQHLLAIRRAIQPLWLSNLTRAYFNQHLLWLEEYPLESPAQGLFVLNGCLYALIGIFDVYTIDNQPYLFDLINEINISLHYMLPYYIHPKISNWSLYDLSHITMKTKPKPASYAYHLVHITLFQCLSELFKKTNLSTSQLFHSYAQRFISAIFSHIEN